MSNTFRACRLTALILLVSALLLPSEANSAQVSVSGFSNDLPSFDSGEITFISFSTLTDKVGGELSWKTVGHEIQFVQDTNRFDFVIGSPFFRRNDSLLNMTYAAAFKSGELFLPAETFIPMLDHVMYQQITWDKSSKTVRVESEYFNVTDIAFSAKANGLLVELYLTSSLAYDVFVTEGNWVNISVRNGKLNVPRISSREDSRYMYDLKAHQTNETGQVSFRLKRSVTKWHHKLQNDPTRIQLSIPDVDFELASENSQPVIGPDDKVDVIVIDPGHGGSHYGAVGPGGTREKEVALDIARELARLIRKDKQFKVIMTRDRDKTVTLQERADIANNSNCDLFISIHANSSVKRSVRGWNVFFLAQAKNDSARAVAQFENSAFFRDHAEQAELDIDTGPSYDDPVLTILNEMIMTEFQVESHDFAMMVDREFRRGLSTHARGVDQAGFYVLNMVFAPSILVESGFISNSQEERVLRDSKYQKAIAEALYDAIKRFKAKYESQ